ncbi:MAG: minor capsid protein [Eubacterium sp.]
MTRLKINPGGPAQKFLLSEARRLSEKYTPRDTGNLYSTSRILPTRHVILYPTPQARYLWNGKVMVGRAPKKVTKKNLKFAGAPMRGPFWVNRMWADNKQQVLRSLARFTRFKKK